MDTGKKDTTRPVESLQTLDEGDSMYESSANGYDDAITYFQNKYDGLTFDYVGGAVPTQADGLYKGQRFYFRFRGDKLSLSLGEDKDIDELPANPVKIVIENYTGDKYAGFLNEKDFQEAFEKLFRYFI